MDIVNKVTPEQISELELQNPDVIVIDSPFGEAAFRPSTPEEWQRFLDEQANPDLKSRALNALVFTCRLAPDKPTFEAMIKRRPGLVQAFGNQLVDHCGLATAVVRKK